MPVSRCRVCGCDFFKKPLLLFKNMPGAAQLLPDGDCLERDGGVDLEVRQCSGCGLVQLSNDPVPYYRDVIRAAGVSPEMRAFRESQFSDFIGRFSLEGKKIIEIGCGRGEYLSIMGRPGVEAFGLEHLDSSVRYCLDSGLRVSRGFVESDSEKIEGAPFDAFFMLNFLEHLPCPNSCLRGIYENLADDAAGLVEVPNFDMMLKKNLFSEFISDHLFYFTRDTLTAALGRNGFEIIDCRTEWYDYILSATVRKRTPLDLSHFHACRSRIRDEIHRYIDGFGAERVAIWGAGHQALAIMSLAELAGKIRYVVDSAPFKQGKYTPATHIPIVPPEMLRSDPVDSVIVMAAGFSDEVAGIIGEKFRDLQIKVAVLRDFGLEVL